MIDAPTLPAPAPTTGHWRIEAHTRLGDLHLDVELAGDARPAVLIGPNGSGKTSVLRIVAGLLAPDAAEIEIGGRVLTSTQRGVQVPVEHRRIGYVPQGHGLFPHLTVVENVAFGLTVSTDPRRRERRWQRARAVLEEIGCAGLADRWPEELSGGQRQRVAVARALAIDPTLLILDEPLAALDAVARRSIRAFLREQVHRIGCPSLIVTHEPRDIAALDARVFALDAGRVVQSGEFEELRRDPATDFIAEFTRDG